jgi:hypothetical protein
MVNYKSGEVSWTDTAFDSSKKTNSKDTFLRLGPGSNIVRLLTLPYQYHQHKLTLPGGKKFGYRINCSGANGSCPICEMGAEHKAKRRWFLGVIDRKNNTYKTLDIGFAVFKAIQTLAKDEDWGDPSRYDIDIVVDPNGGSTGYYTVVAKPPKPLSASDLVIKEENDPENLVRMTSPPTAEKVLEKIARIKEEIKAQGENTSLSSNNEEDSTDDEENVFKDYDKKKSNPF